MEHLTRQKMVLYHSNRGLSFALRQEIEQHLQLCDRCRLLQEQLKKRLENMVENNARECQNCQQNLIALTDGDLNIQTSHKTEKHLQECEACHALYTYLTNLLRWENVVALEIWLISSHRRDA